MYGDEQYLSGLHEVISAFRQAAKTEYFSFVDSGDFEYLVSAEYHVFDTDKYYPSHVIDEQGKGRVIQKGPFRSHLVMTLWFVGGKPVDRGSGRSGVDHNFTKWIKDWESWSEDTDPLSHKAAILSQIQATPPLHEIAWDYERMPVTIEMEPEKECVEYDEEVRINIKSSRDREGRNAQPFYGGGCDNRFVFTTEHGKILLSDENKIGENEWATSADYNYYMYQAPSADECGDCKEDTITVYNSCDVLDPDVYPYSQTQKNEKIYEITIDIGCDWEGTIASTFGSSAEGDESLITALMPKSKYKGITNWELDVVFKLDRGNERVKIYELKSAKFSYSGTTELDWKLKGKHGKFQTEGDWAAQVEARNLSPSECDLELIIDLKKKTYKIEGVLHVKNITEKFKGEVEVVVTPIIHEGQKDTDDQMIEHKEEVLIEGEFSEDFPWELEGSLDEMKTTPPEFQEFMEAMAGDISSKIRWKLDRKGKH